MRSRYKFIPEHNYFFITTTIVEWIPIFTSEKYFQIIKNCLDFCVKSGKFEVIAWVILDNHCHLVISGENLSEGVKSFKSFTAKEIVTQLKNDKKDWCLNQLSFFRKKYKTTSKHQVWQEGVHPQAIVSEEMLEQKIDYIHCNPVRRGLVLNMEDWRWSSACDFQSGAF